MAKKGGRSGRRPPTRRPIRPRSNAAAPHDQPLLQDLRRGLRSDEPLDLLLTVSGLLEVTDPSGRNPFERDAPPVGRGELIESFLDTDFAETTAALTIIRALVPDEVMAARIGRELATRRQPLPRWLDGLERARIVEPVWFMTHVLGDGDDYFVGVQLATGVELAALVYVDHNMGTIVKDAFLVPASLDELLERVRSTMDEDQSLTPVDPAHARAVLEAAIEHGARMYPPVTSETWPACRPVVEWLLRKLPAGGALPAPKEWTEAETGAIATDFFASSFGRAFDRPEQRDLFESLMWFGTDYATGDPLNWSPVTVEMALVDWFPRKIMAPAARLAELPELLRAYVRYCHARRGIRPALTEETLAAVTQWEPEYQRLIRTERLQGPQAVLAGVIDGQADDDDDDFDDQFYELYDDEYEDFDFTEYRLDRLAWEVGGRQQLQQLDDAPLPDEPFRWTGIPDRARPQVEQALELCDRCADELLDVEHRTAMRRFLGRAAVGDPATFTRKAAPARTAAAVAWVICRANDSANANRALKVQDLLAWFGVKGSVSQRAEPLLRANGVDPYARYGDMALGAPDLLVSRRRAAIIAARDRLSAE